MSAPLSAFFGRTEPVRFEGPQSASPLAFRHYDKDRVVLGRRMEDHFRFAVCWWHSLVWPGTDPFGGPSFVRPWSRPGDAMAEAEARADAAFELFRLLDIPFFTFHDRDIAPEGASPAESATNLRRIADGIARRMETSRVKLLWGTANCFSHRRYLAGAATNPDPEVFAYAAHQVATAMDVTRELGGENYVLWGGREGYETLLNTDLAREQDQAGRFLSMVVEHKHRTGFKGTILIEPKPKEPTKHQYDYDVATVYGFLRRYGLEAEVKVNIEQNHATLAGHSFEHEIALAAALGIFGSIDLNRGDELLGWDTDQFAVSVPQLTLAMIEILRAGGFTTGGLNFDAKVRRQSIDGEDLLHAHVGSMDATARALLAAAAILEEGTFDRLRRERYAGWDAPEGKAILEGRRSLGDVASRVEREGREPTPRSGRQEALENWINRFV